MSDSSYYTVDRKTRNLLDVVDKEWEEDFLSDDGMIFRILCTVLIYWCSTT